MGERDFLEEVHLEAINQNKKHEERAPLMGKMTHLRENYQRLSSNSLFFSQRSWSSQNCTETQQPWSDLWSRPFHPWTPKENLESTDKETGLLSSVLKPAHTNIFCPPHFSSLENEWRVVSRRLGSRAESRGDFTWRLLLAGLFCLLPCLLKMISSVT